MSFKSLLTDKVDIFYLKERDCNYGYGIESTPGKDKQYYYDTIPDYKGVPCYCYSVGGTTNGKITENDVNNKVYEMLKVQFLKNADIRMNTKISYEGEFYILQKPKTVRRHHIEVIAIREDYL